jgi:hypothetical protein
MQEREWKHYANGGPAIQRCECHGGVISMRGILEVTKCLEIADYNTKIHCIRCRKAHMLQSLYAKST